ncbi:hypothetical protein C1645_863597 [Glomus cerebriforme]|uniref:Uncharacterized protein n=1 Tax=Glomus cerebriforme TaxID=658196 RepID=A0A397SDH0_9GLOM|nr:hypothetical protein C1645_863597 [Glomus cerebriforme]
MSSSNNILENSENQPDNIDDPHTNDEFIKTYEIVNGYDENDEEIMEHSPQKRKKLDNSIKSNNQMNGDVSESFTVLKNYVEITQEEFDKKNNDMKRLEIENSSLTKNLEQTSVTLKSMSEDFNKINDQNNKLQNENNKLKEDNDNLLKEKQSLEQNLVNYYESKIKDLELKLHVQQTHGKTDIITSLQNQLNDKENDIRDLKQRNINLKDEASKYQSALGDATNVRLGNDDRNHSVQLKQDILELQRTLESYVTNLKPNIDINVKEVNIIIKQYGCQNEIKPSNLNKPFVKAILQRKVLQQIFDFSKNYRKYHRGGNNFTLESEIDLKALELSDIIKKFSETRVGTDEVSKVAAIKIRQQIYEILGNRGFSDIISCQDTFTHNFISHYSKILNETTNQYRQINDVERKNEVEKLAPILIRDALRIFWFRLMVQEPIPEIKFFEHNDKINPDLMTGRWEDDELDESCVDLCYFPLIGRDLDSDYKIITPAKILSCPIQNQRVSNNKEYEQNKIEDNLGFVTRFLYKLI